jgi:hypothetical protein
MFVINLGELAIVTYLQAGSKAMRPRRNEPAAEQQDAQEARLEEECRETLISH